MIRPTATNTNLLAIAIAARLSPCKTRTMQNLKNLLAKLPHPVRWVVTMIVGFILLILGLIMMVTPGPGLLFIFFGLSVLSLEIEWARELNKAGLQGLEKIVAKIKLIFQRK